jgi:hypothetical protein
VISFRGSSSIKPSPLCVETPRKAGQSNEEWLRAVVDDMEDPDKPSSFVVLIGGTSVYDFRLRVAQSHLRSDLTPSHWSHVAMVSSANGKIGTRAQILEVSLEPYEGFQVPSLHNGLQIAPLRRYASPDEYPNIAVIRVPVDSREWRDDRGDQKSILTQFADQRVVLDVTVLMLEWLAFAWCAGDAGNPLLDGHGIPSAAVIESLVGATGYDLSPGLDTSAASPEAFWQTAKWWQDYYAEMGIGQMETKFHIAEDISVGDAAAAKGGGGSSKSPKTSRPGGADGRRSTKAPAATRSRESMPRPRMLTEQSMTAHMFRRA